MSESNSSTQTTSKREARKLNPRGPDAKNARDAKKPEIFKYHDYREFLKDQIDYLHKTKGGYSLRATSNMAGLTVAYLSLILRGLRNLTPNAQEKLFPVLKLNRTEKSFFKLLCQLADTEDNAERMQVLKKLQRFPAYQKSNGKEQEVHRYMTHWYYVAICEMTDLPDFRLDPKWIQKKLKGRIAIGDVEQAIGFLVNNGYLKFDESGKVYRENKHVDCVGGVYRVALENFHREMYEMAADSFENTPRQQRIVDAYTCAIDYKDIDAVKKIINKALDEIVKVAGKKKADGEVVYHVSVAGFPLTEQGSVGEDETPENTNKSTKSLKVKKGA